MDRHLFTLSFISSLLIADPSSPSITHHSTTIYLGAEEGMVDQFWLSHAYQDGTLSKQIQLIDVRSHDRFTQGHLEGAINCPYDATHDRIDLSSLPKQRVIVLYCNEGIKATEAFMSLSEEQKESIFYVDAQLKCHQKSCYLIPNEEL
jgi:rhodanese-related sulfurtransferase